MDRAREYYSIAEAELVSGEKERKRGVQKRTEGSQTFPLQWWVTICFDNSASEAEVITDIMKSGKMSHQIHESLSHHYVPVSTLEECVVKVVKEDGKVALRKT